MGPRQAKTTRARLTSPERASLMVAVAGVIGFGIFGIATEAPSTIGYMFSVAVVGIGLASFRRQPLPGWLAAALAVLALGHMAGGLVIVGGDVLYNAHPSIHAFQYDHIFHASASGVAAIVLWLFIADEIRSRVGAVVVSVLGGLGVGALNELIEFLATLAHHGSHVGGYRNTGWDLLSNALGATVATGVMVSTVRRRSRV
jgi:hypothetical protein